MVGKMTRKLCFMNNAGFDFCEEVVLEAIIPLMGVGLYFAGGMRSMLEADA